MCVAHRLFRANGSIEILEAVRYDCTKSLIGGTLKVSLQGGYQAQAGQRFDLFDWRGSSGQFAALDLSAAPRAAGLRWDTSQLYVDGTIGVAAVPEPGSPWLLLAGLLGIAQRLARARAASVTSSGPR